MRTGSRAQRNSRVSAAAPSQARAASHSPGPIAPASPVLPRYIFDLAQSSTLLSAQLILFWRKVLLTCWDVSAFPAALNAYVWCERGHMSGVDAD